MVKSPLARVLLCLAVLALIRRSRAGIAEPSRTSLQSTAAMKSDRGQRGRPWSRRRSPNWVGRGSDDDCRQPQHLPVRPVLLLLREYHLWPSGFGLPLSTQFVGSHSVSHQPPSTTVTRIEASVGTFGGSDASGIQVQILREDNNVTSPGKLLSRRSLLQD